MSCWTILWKTSDALQKNNMTWAVWVKSSYHNDLANGDAEPKIAALLLETARFVSITKHNNVTKIIV